MSLEAKCTNPLWSKAFQGAKWSGNQSVCQPSFLIHLITFTRFFWNLILHEDQATKTKKTLSKEGKPNWDYQSMFWKILSGVFFCKNFTLVRKCKIRWYALSMYKLIWNELFSKIKYRFSQGIKCMEFIEAHAKFYKIVWCCLEGRLWLIYHLFLFIGKLENQMQKIRATIKKGSFWWFLVTFLAKKSVPFNHCALTWQYWWQKIPRTK